MKSMNDSFHLNLKRFFVLFALFLSASSAGAQTKSQGAFVSSADQEISIKSVVLVPFNDNLSGIYSKPLTDTMTETLTKDPRWNLVSLPGGKYAPEKFDENPAEVQKILRQSKADALITGRIQKGPAGLSMRMSLFAGSSGLPLAVEESTEGSVFEIDRMKSITQQTFQKLRDRLPYKGTVLSRRGQEVTINIGKNSGVKNGAEVLAIQILKINRHPKLNFMVSAEKEIIGKIRIFKADDELSFGNLTFEKETGAVVPGMKVLPDEGVKYGEPFVGPDGKRLESINDRADKNVVFGEKPVEWLPEPPPQYGRVQVAAGIGQYSQTAKLASAGSISGTNTMSPNLAIMAEGWLNKEWALAFNLRQSAFSIDNGLNGSSPNKINMSVSKYDITGDYNFLLSNDFFGPKIQLGAGLGKFSARADQTSPQLFSNMEFGGMLVNFVFTTPLSDQTPWDIGARFKYFWSPKVSESLSSGSAKSVSANDFSFLTGYRVRKNFRYVGEFNIEYYNADFDGNGDRTDPASTIGHRVTTITVGLEYMF